MPHRTPKSRHPRQRKRQVTEDRRALTALGRQPRTRLLPVPLAALRPLLEQGGDQLELRSRPRHWLGVVSLGATFATPMSSSSSARCSRWQLTLLCRAAVGDL